MYLAVFVSRLKVPQSNGIRNCILQAKSELVEWASQVIWIVYVIVMWELNGLADSNQI